MTARKTETPIERIDRMLQEYAALNDAAVQLIEAHVQELATQIPGVPAGAIRLCEFDNRAGEMMHMPNALRILRAKL
jgi:hypothetical protein